MTEAQPPVLDLCSAAVESYRWQRRAYLALASEVATRCQRLVADLEVPASLQSRAKDTTSLEKKLGRKLAARVQKYVDQTDATSLLGQVEDLAAVRVLPYLASDRSRIAEAIQEHFSDGASAPRREDKTPEDRGDFYTAVHLHVTLSDEASRILEIPSGMVCEIQVTSMMAHIWAEMEHDIRYKRPPDAVGLTPGEASALQALGGLVEAGDYLVEALLARHAEAVGEDLAADEVTDAAGAPETVRELLRAAFPSARGYEVPSFLLDALKKMALDGRDGLRENVLTGEDPEARARQAVDAFNGFTATQDESQRLIASSGADLLTALLISEHADALTDAVRNPGYPSKLAQVFRWSRAMEAWDSDAPIPNVSGERLRAVREGVMSQTEVSERVGVSQPAVAGWEGSREQPIPRWAVALLAGVLPGLIDDASGPAGAAGDPNASGS